MKQSLERQSGVQSVEVSLIDGTAKITPKVDGQIDPAQLLKVTYDSGATVAEMDMTAQGKIVRDPAGGLVLQVEPNRSFELVPGELAKRLETFANSQTIVTVRGQLYKKPAGKKKLDKSALLKLTILGVEKKE